jgi:hypothetical protein
MVERKATCLCGQLFIRCRGEPAIVANCHCFKCQQRTGSVSSNAAFYRRADIIETGGQSTKFSRTGDRGYFVTNHFCPVCGSTVYWEREVPADWIGISVGSFADPTFPKPSRAVWTQNKHHWVVLPDDIVQIAQNPD